MTESFNGSSAQEASKAEGKYRLAKTDVAIILASLLIVIVFAFTAETELRWVGHAAAGLTSFAFAIYGVIVGAILTGRAKRIQGINLFKLHKKINVYVTLLIVATFIYGLWSRTAHGEFLFWQHTEPLATVLEGWVGLILMIVALSQTLPCFVTKDRRKIKTAHMILGYTLIVLLVIVTLLGIAAAIIELSETAELALVFPP